MGATSTSEPSLALASDIPILRQAKAEYAKLL
jgi:hypothetical protein